MPTAANQSRNDARSQKTEKKGSFFDSRAETLSMNLSVFDALRDTVGGINASVFDARSEKINKNVSVFDSCGNMVGVCQSRNDARSQTIGIASSWLDARLTATALNASRQLSLYQSGYYVYAKDVSSGVETLLGWIDATASPKKLSDVSLSDGTYEITVRISDLFWDDCRDGKRLTVTVAAGIVSVYGLPAIDNLRREIKNQKSWIEWSIKDEYNLSDIEFGLWFGNSSPVSISGQPDYTVMWFAGQNNYVYKYAQTTSKYVAVCTMTSTQKGPKSELYIPWSSVAPTAPDNQLAQKQ